MMNAFNEILDTVSPIFEDAKGDKQDALASLLAEAVVEAAPAPQQGIAIDDSKAA